MSIPSPYNINSTKVDLSNRKLYEVPTWLQLLPNLEDLDLSMNRISEIPEWLGNMTGLKVLDLYKNTIDLLPESNNNLINIEHIRLSYNHFRFIPQCINYMHRLKYLNISHNMIQTIPSSIFENCINLESVCIHNNYLTNIPSSIENLTQLNELVIMKNDIITLPISITRLNLTTFYYKDNPYEYMSPQVLRYMHRLSNKIDNLHIYSDAQSVHTSSIQKSIVKSIENITSQNIKIDIDSTLYEILNDVLINCKSELSNDILIEDIHSTLHITFKELLCYVWETIKTLDHQHQDEIKNRLNQEIYESKNKCFTGKLSRLINCLNGFTDLVSITIDESEEIGNIITIVRHRLGEQYTVEEHKKIVIEELKERGYPHDTILHWLDYIE